MNYCRKPQVLIRSGSWENPGSVSSFRWSDQEICFLLHFWSQEPWCNSSSTKHHHNTALYNTWIRFSMLGLLSVDFLSLCWSETFNASRYFPEMILEGLCREIWWNTFLGMYISNSKVEVTCALSLLAHLPRYIVFIIIPTWVVIRWPLEMQVSAIMSLSTPGWWGNK